MSTITPFRRVVSRDIMGPDISGVQDAINRCEHVLSLGTASIAGHAMAAVEDQPDATQHRRIYEGTIRGWLESPAPVIRRGGAVVPVGEYTLFAAQGAIVFGAQQAAGTVITADFTHVTNVSAMLSFLHPLRTADRRYAGGQANAFPLTTGAPTAGVLRAMPFIISRHVTLDRMAINVTAAAAGNASMGIYHNTLATMYPAGLIVAAPEVATGTAAVVEAMISQALAPGLYWLALVSSAAPTIRTLAPEGCQPVLGLEPALGINPGVGWSAAFAYAALPATFPADAAPITAAPIPAIFVRASA